MGIETAIIGAAAVGAISSSKAASSASKASQAATSSADAAAQLQYQASSEQLAFQKQQYDDWEGIFGPIQSNLSNYYKNLSSDTVASLGLQNIETQYVSSRQNLDTALAKRGITNSGATVSGLTQLESARMLGKAEVQANAPAQTAAQQLGFLQTGLGQQSSLQQGISNSYTNQMNMFGQQATSNLNQANQYSQQAAAGYAGIGSSIGQGINTYMTANAYQSQANLNNTMANQMGGNYTPSSASYGATTSWWG